MTKNEKKFDLYHSNSLVTLLALQHNSPFLGLEDSRTAQVGRDHRKSAVRTLAQSGAAVRTVKSSQSPGMGISQPLWTACSTVWLSSWDKKLVFLYYSSHISQLHLLQLEHTWSKIFGKTISWKRVYRTTRAL